MVGIFDNYGFTRYRDFRYTRCSRVFQPVNSNYFTQFYGECSFMVSRMHQFDSSPK